MEDICRIRYIKTTSMEDAMQKDHMSDAQKVKKAYFSPKLVKWGTVADLTKTGLTHEGDDGKIGSILHSKGR